MVQNLKPSRLLPQTRPFKCSVNINMVCVMYTHHDPSPISSGLPQPLVHWWCKSCRHTVDHLTRARQYWPECLVLMEQWKTLQKRPHRAKWNGPGHLPNTAAGVRDSLSTSQALFRAIQWDIQGDGSEHEVWVSEGGIYSWFTV